MSNSKPTRPQLRHLRQLAERTGSTFHTVADPSPGKRRDRAAQAAPASSVRDDAAGEVVDRLGGLSSCSSASSPAQPEM